MPVKLERQDLAQHFQPKQNGNHVNFRVTEHLSMSHIHMHV
jgi:hypothetical protein